MVNQWFKFYGAEFLSDPKVESLSAQERSCWLTILCLASVSSESGIIKYLTPEILLKKSGIEFDPYDTSEWDNNLTILKRLENFKMIKVNDDSSIEILNWVKRQESFLTNAERQAKFREKHSKINKNNEKVTDCVTKVTLEEKRREENRYTKGVSVSISPTLPEEIKTNWNKFNNWQVLGVPQAKIRNTSVIKKLLPEFRKITPEFIAVLKKKKITIEDATLAIQKYIQDIVNRVPDKTNFYEHRFSCYEFFKQENGFTKFINK